MYEIYELSDASGVFWVGCSSNLKGRLELHRDIWGCSITCNVLETFNNKENAREAEIQWIAIRHFQGCNLRNKSNVPKIVKTREDGVLRGMGPYPLRKVVKS